MPSDGAGTSRNPLIKTSNVAIAHLDGAAVRLLRPPVARRSLRPSRCARWNLPALVPNTKFLDHFSYNLLNLKDILTQILSLTRDQNTPSQTSTDANVLCGRRFALLFLCRHGIRKTA